MCVLMYVFVCFLHLGRGLGQLPACPGALAGHVHLMTLINGQVRVLGKSRVWLLSLMSRVVARLQARPRDRWFLRMPAPAATPPGRFSRPPGLLVPGGSIFPWVGALARASITSVPLQAWCHDPTRALPLARRHSWHVECAPHSLRPCPAHVAHTGLRGSEGPRVAFY